MVNQLGIAAVAAVLALVMSAVPIQAQESPGFAHEGVYVGGGMLPSTTLDDPSFAGGIYYEAEDDGELFVLPTLDSLPLPRIVVGFRSRPFALEFSYDRARHTGTFVDLDRESTFHAINIDGRFFFATHTRVQPHAVIGGSIPWLTVDDGSFVPGSDFTDEPQADATFRGPGLNTEVGVTVFATPRVGVSVGYAYRVIWFQRVRGIGDDPKELKPPFHVGRGQVAIMGFVTF